MSKEDKLNQAGLVRVGGALFPADRAAREQEELEKKQLFFAEFGNQEGIAELEKRVKNAEKALEDWNQANPTICEYIEAIDLWKRTPIFPGDEEESVEAQNRMREIEAKLNIDYHVDSQVFHYPVDELRSRGYSEEKIGIMQKIAEGRNLRYAVKSRTEELNIIKNMMRRRD